MAAAAAARRGEGRLGRARARVRVGGGDLGWPAQSGSGGTAGGDQVAGGEWR